MKFELDPVECRALGCLLEKERTTPEVYPMSLNSLTNACNQSTSRDPVVAWDEGTVEKGLERLRSKGLATMIHAAGSRVPKYRHLLPEQFELERREIALLCVLLLRGAQTPGELRSRTQRLYAFETLEELEGCLAAMSSGADPIVKLLPPQAGQKEQRYTQLLSSEVYQAAQEIAIPFVASAPAPGLAEEVAALRAELEVLREEFRAFKAQF